MILGGYIKFYTVAFNAGSYSLSLSTPNFKISLPNLVTIKLINLEKFYFTKLTLQSQLKFSSTFKDEL